MARYNETTKIIGNLIRDKNRIKTNVGGLNDTESYLKAFFENINLEVVDLRVRVRSANADAFIIGHESQSIIGTSKLGNTGSGFGSWGDLVKRRYVYRARKDLAEGTKSNNITIQDGTIQLGL